MVKAKYSKVEELYIVTLPHKTYRFKSQDNAEGFAAKCNRKSGFKGSSNAFNIMMHDDRIPTKKKQYFR